LHDLSPSSSSCTAVVPADGGINVPTKIQRLAKGCACTTTCQEEEEEEEPGDDDGDGDDRESLLLESMFQPSVPINISFHLNCSCGTGYTNQVHRHGGCARPCGGTTCRTKVSMGICWLMAVLLVRVLELVVLVLILVSRRSVLCNASELRAAWLPPPLPPMAWTKGQGQYSRAYKCW